MFKQYSRYTNGKNILANLKFIFNWASYILSSIEELNLFFNDTNDFFAESHARF